MDGPCPECGSSDRRTEDDRYALLEVTEPREGGGTLRASEGRVGGFTVAVTVCNNCGAVALQTKI